MDLRNESMQSILQWIVEHVVNMIERKIYLNLFCFEKSDFGLHKSSTDDFNKSKSENYSTAAPPQSPNVVKYGKNDLRFSIRHLFKINLHLTSNFIPTSNIDVSVYARFALFSFFWRIRGFIRVRRSIAMQMFILMSKLWRAFYEMTVEHFLDEFTLRWLSTWKLQKTDEIGFGTERNCMDSNGMNAMWMN